MKQHKTVIFSPEQLRLLLAHRQLKWSAFIHKKVIMIERISFHGKVGRHLGRLSLICTAQHQFVAIAHIEIPPSMRGRVLDFVIDPHFPARGTSIKYLLREIYRGHQTKALNFLNHKIIRDQHEEATQDSLS